MRTKSFSIMSMKKIKRTIIWCGAIFRRTLRVVLANLAVNAGSITWIPRSREQTGPSRNNGFSSFSGTSRTKNGHLSPKSSSEGPIIPSKIIGILDYVREFKICKKLTISISNAKKNSVWYSFWVVMFQRSLNVSKRWMFFSSKVNWTKTRSLTCKPLSTSTRVITWQEFLTK